MSILQDTDKLLAGLDETLAPVPLLDDILFGACRGYRDTSLWRIKPGGKTTEWQYATGYVKPENPDHQTDEILPFSYVDMDAPADDDDWNDYRVEKWIVLSPREQYIQAVDHLIARVVNFRSCNMLPEYPWYSKVGIKTVARYILRNTTPFVLATTPMEEIIEIYYEFRPDWD